MPTPKKYKLELSKRQVEVNFDLLFVGPFKHGGGVEGVGGLSNAKHTRSIGAVQTQKAVAVCHLTETRVATR